MVPAGAGSPAAPPGPGQSPAARQDTAAAVRSGSSPLPRQAPGRGLFTSREEAELACQVSSEGCGTGRPAERGWGAVFNLDTFKSYLKALFREWLRKCNC